MDGTHIVLRDFTGSRGVRFTSRQVVDATAWPNASALVRAHYIRPRTVTDLAQDAKPPARPIRGSK